MWLKALIRKRISFVRVIVGAKIAFMTLLLFTDAHAGNFSGTWSGTVTSNNGQTAQGIYNFSDSGLLVFSYQDNRGQVRSVELSSPGQVIQYVPPGGGVKTHEVRSISNQDEYLSFVFATKFEKFRNGVGEQVLIVDYYDFQLNGENIIVRIREQVAPHYGLTGEITETSSEGSLQKVNN
jgi:hypothetical protein